jgi:hypothetical protein
MTSRTSLALFAMILAGAACGCSDENEPVPATSSTSPIGCAAPNQDTTYNPVIDAANFPNPTKIDNPYNPYPNGAVFTAKDADGNITTTTVTSETRTIMGIPCVIVHDIAKSPAGDIIEDTYDWYAQDKDGNVWYFGEDTKAYAADGTISKAGSWEAGIDCAKPGIVMEANPKVGDSYRQEYQAGNAEDKADVVALNESITVAYGSFNNCLKTKDYTDLEPGVFEYKWFCPGVGWVRAQDATLPGTPNEDLLTITLPAAPIGCAAPQATYAPASDPSNFPNSTNIDNPLLPLPTGAVFTAKDADGNITTTTVTTDTKVIAGVTCVVVHDIAKSSDGTVIEDTYDWYAQDKNGNVWYFGEDTKLYIAGGSVSTAGSWEAGVDCAKPGIVMETAPKVGDSYRQEYQAGNAEDKADIVALNESITVAYGSFTGCLKTRDYSDLEPGVFEYKWFCPGVGWVRAQDATLVGMPNEDLISVTGLTAGDGGTPDGGAPDASGTPDGGAPDASGTPDGGAPDASGTPDGAAPGDGSADGG